MLIDVLAGFILSKDIQVSKVALMSNISVYRKNLNVIERKDLPQDLAPEIKVGRFSSKDDKIIKEN